MPEFKLQEIEPYLAIVGDEGFNRGWKTDPNSGTPVLVADIQTRMLDQFGEFDYFGVKKDPKDYTDEDKARRKELFENPESATICKKMAKMPSAEVWWIGGMQKQVVKTVHLVLDDPEDGIFIFYAFMNNPKYMKFLGRLKDDTELHNKALAAFQQFARKAVE